MTDTQQSIAFPLRLRNETASMHTALEELPVSKNLLSPDLNEDSYVLYLSLMYNVVRHAEDSLFPILAAIVPDIEERRMLHFIMEDLAFFGRPAVTNTEIFGQGHSEAFVMGILYVLQGSSLGGRVIFKHVQKQLGVNELRGGRYFAGYGEDTGPKWKSFIAFLSAYEERTGNGAEIIAGANFAFERIREHLEKSTPA